MTAPALRVLSLGAGVQSTTVAMLAAEGRIPPIDAAIFADTGWEPRAVYDHLDRLDREVLQPSGIPLHIVSNGNLREDTVTPGRRYVAVPFYLRNLDGGDGMGRRQCTAEYKLVPIKRKVRELLGAPVDPDTGRIGRVPGKPGERYVEQLIGISLDEIHRARDSDVLYARNGFPLLDLRWTRKDCLRYLDRRGWSTTPKSACIGCPFHGNRAWRDLRDNHPDEWADAVAFDRELRNEATFAHLDLTSQPYLHRSRVPLDQAPIDRVTSREHADRQIDLLDVLADDEADEEIGCSPFACRSDLPGEGDAA